MKKILLLVIIVANYVSLFAQKFYDLKTIQKIEIQFAFDDWKAKLDAATALPSDLPTIALWVKVNGVKFDSVSVKFKGNSSYKASNAKNPLHIDLAAVKGKQNYDGYTDIKLANGFSDPTFIREALSYRILSDYMDSPKANFANVYINGKKYGFFTNDESVSKAFYADRFGENNGTIVKCTPAAFSAGGGPGGTTGYCTLKYLGADTSLYKSKYDMKSSGVKELVNLCDTVTNQPATMEKIIDVNRSLWMLAFNNLFINLDSYTGTFAQNYYLYRDKTHRFLPILWDLNMSFNGFPMGSTGATTNAFLGNTNADRPLIKNLLANPTYKKMYVAHIKTMIDEWFANGKYMTEGLAIQAIADTAFNNDPNKMNTYANFKTALTTNITGGGGGPGGGGGSSGIKPLMEARMAYYKTVGEFQEIAPTINTTKPTNLTIGKSFVFTAKIKNATSAIFKYRSKNLDIFTTLPLYNDGTNGDAVANDSIWSLTFTPQLPDYQYYIWAENADAGIFSPRAVELNYHTFSAKGVNGIAAGSVVVNELMANNKSIIKAPNGKYSDWFELYNTTNATIDLSNAALSDNFTTPKKWLFPVGTKINAGQYLIVWADDADTGTGLHAAFKLTDNGERFMLSDAQGKVLDSLSFDNQKADYSLARCPNGTGKFVITNPTFGVTNGNCKKVNVATNDLATNNLVVFPNPTNDVLTIRNEDNLLGKIQLFDLTGRVVFSQKYDSHEAVLDLQNFPNGMYLLQAEGSSILKIVKD